jgi:hypothetical protein
VDLVAPGRVFVTDAAASMPEIPSIAAFSRVRQDSDPVKQSYGME